MEVTASPMKSVYSSLVLLAAGVLVLLAGCATNPGSGGPAGTGSPASTNGIQASGNSVGGAGGGNGGGGGGSQGSIDNPVGPPPDNNSCANPIAITEGSFNFDTSGATTDGPAESFCTSTNGDQQIGADIWYCYTPTTTGTVTFSLCGSSFDTKIAVYSGCGCPAGNDTSIVCDDDGCGGTGGPSQVKLTVTAGQQYLVRIGGGTDSNGVNTRGTGTLAVTYDGLPDLVCSADAPDPQITTRTFAPGDCAVTEGCVKAGTRKLLIFSAETRNVGAADLALGHPANSPLYFQLSACDNEYHLTAFAEFSLLSAGGQVAVTRKQGFCLSDDRRYGAGTGGGTSYTTGAAAGALYTCANQGLQSGWADLYQPTFACQYLDITGVPAGSYTLRLTANANHVLPESNYNNNSVDVPVTIP